MTPSSMLAALACFFSKGMSRMQVEACGDGAVWSMLHLVELNLAYTIGEGDLQRFHVNTDRGGFFRESLSQGRP